MTASEAALSAGEPILVKLRRERRLARVAVLAWQIGIGIGFVVAWQLLSGPVLNPRWFSSPAAVALKLGTWIASGELWTHAAVTLSEMLVGFGIGTTAGALAGLAYGAAPRFERLANPVVLGLYGIPLVAFLAMQIGVDGRAILPFILLRTGVRAVPVPLRVPPQSLQGEADAVRRRPLPYGRTELRQVHDCTPVVPWRKCARGMSLPQAPA